MKSLKWMFAVIITCSALSSSPIFATDKAESGVTHSAEIQIVNVNQADAKTLADRLNGVGLKKARAIIAYREENGLFANAEDLKKVKGVGAAILKKNAERIKF